MNHSLLFMQGLLTTESADSFRKLGGGLDDLASNKCAEMRVTLLKSRNILGERRINSSFSLFSWHLLTMGSFSNIAGALLSYAAFWKLCYFMELCFNTFILRHCSLRVHCSSKYSMFLYSVIASLSSFRISGLYSSAKPPCQMMPCTQNYLILQYYPPRMPSKNKGACCDCGEVVKWWIALWPKSRKDWRVFW